MIAFLQLSIWIVRSRLTRLKLRFDQLSNILNPHCPFFVWTVEVQRMLQGIFHDKLPDKKNDNYKSNTRPRMSGTNEEELNHGLPEVDEQDQEEEQEEKNPREGLGKIIDRERGSEGKLSNARLL